MKKLKFKAKLPGIDDPERALAELDELYEKNGKLTPEVVVKAAKSPTSTLHDYFEWRDKEAANKHRLAQARRLIGSIQVIDLRGDRTPRRMTVHVKEGPSGRGYYKPEDLEGHDKAVNEVVRKAHNDLMSWLSRYDELREMFPEDFERLEALTRSLSSNIAA